MAGNMDRIHTEAKLAGLEDQQAAMLAVDHRFDRLREVGRARYRADFAVELAGLEEVQTCLEGSLVA
jgi:hypothetical protein